MKKIVFLLAVFTVMAQTAFAQSNNAPLNEQLSPEEHGKIYLYTFTAKSFDCYSQTREQATVMFTRKLKVVIDLSTGTSHSFHLDGTSLISAI